MLRILFPIFFIVLAFAIFFFYFYLGLGRTLPPGSKSKLVIHGQTFEIELADTAARRTQGLSGRANLPADTGLYFIFPSKDNQGFWMKDMLFAIDIVWINDNKVSGIEKNVPPEPGVSIFKLKVYYPPSPVDRVLEVSAGTADKYGIQPGDEVTFAQQ